MVSQLASASYELKVSVAASPERVWQVLVGESAGWWPKEFHTSERVQRFVIEPVLGGRAYEDYGGGDGLVWYSVVGVETGRWLMLAGHLLPPFGGPAVTALRLTLSDEDGGSQLLIEDDRFGVVGESPLEGWQLVFATGLRSYVEGGEAQT